MWSPTSERESTLQLSGQKVTGCSLEFGLGYLQSNRLLLMVLTVKLPIP